MINQTSPPPFPAKTSPAWAARIDPNNPADPLLLQVAPSELEKIVDASLLEDPVGDLDATLAPGILQKYHGRVLVNLWNECPIHCRFCFRRNLTPTQFVHLGKNLKPLISLLEADPTINEVIFSGGDPFMADVALIKHALTEVTALASIRRIRFHTRVPIARPDRIDSTLLALFEPLQIPVTWALHINHPNEIDRPVQRVLKNLRHTPIHLLSQTVLLNGVNNHAATLHDLFEALFNHGVLPYYLHLPDRAAGTHHFQVSVAEAQCILAKLQTKLPGYLVPRLVQEIAGKPSKTLIVPELPKATDRI